VGDDGADVRESAQFAVREAAGEFLQGVLDPEISERSHADRAENIEHGDDGGTIWRPGELIQDGLDGHVTEIEGVTYAAEPEQGFLEPTYGSFWTVTILEITDHGARDEEECGGIEDGVIDLWANPQGYCKEKRAKAQREG
jgi:hypothetical protein